VKILFITSTFPRWEHDTQATFVFDLAENLQVLGDEIVVLAPHHKGAKSTEIMNGVRVYRFAYFFPKRLQELSYGAGMLSNFKKSWLAKIQVPFFFIAQTFWTFYLVIKEKPDYIHAHWLFMQGFTGAIVSSITRKPLIVTAHGSDLFSMQKGYRKWLVKFAAKNAKVVTVNSTATQNVAKTVFNIHKVQMIPMGVNTQLFTPSKIKSNIKKKLGIKGSMILWLGRLVEVKGLQYGIEAISKVQSSLPDAKLVVIGDGQEKESLINLARTLEAENAIIFYGSLPNSELPAFFQAADLFLGTSITAKDGSTEAFGVVNLEALASGTPVVATNVGGIKDIIKHNECGFLVEPQNSKAIANAIRKILTDKKSSIEFSKAGRIIAEDNYSWPAIAQQFKQVYLNKVNGGY
jgi:glycosyltransferase involved in cell wall biosynthesis